MIAQILRKAMVRAAKRERDPERATQQRLETELAELKAAGKPSVIDLPSMRVAQ